MIDLKMDNQTIANFYNHLLNFEIEMQCDFHTWITLFGSLANDHKIAWPNEFFGLKIVGALAALQIFVSSSKYGRVDMIALNLLNTFDLQTILKSIAIRPKCNDDFLFIPSENR